MKLAGDRKELRNSGSQILKVRNPNSAAFSVRNSAINLVVRNVAELRRCGLKLRMPTFAKYTCPFVVVPKFSLDIFMPYFLKQNSKRTAKNILQSENDEISPEKY